jgi:imidazolonepropionase-like amidohydrolase
VRLERRERWERRRDAAQALHAAGVPFAFGTAGEKPGDVLGKVRDLVEAGLSRDVALLALTRVPAKFAGLEGRLGQVAAGFDATVVLWEGDPLTDKQAEVRYLFVDGYAWDAESVIDAGGEDDSDDRSNSAGEEVRQEAKQ